MSDKNYTDDVVELLISLLQVIQFHLVSGVCASNAIAVCPISRDKQENVISCAAVIAGTVITSVRDQSWPFIKTSGIRKTIDSVDIFTRMPQMPHFSPLNEYEENSGEKLAIGLMMRFAYEVDEISRLSPDDLNDRLRESELQEKLEEVEGKIRKCETEKTAVENEISMLGQQLKSLGGKLESAKSKKCLKDQELAETWNL